MVARYEMGLRLRWLGGIAESGGCENDDARHYIFQVPTVLNSSRLHRSHNVFRMWYYDWKIPQGRHQNLLPACQVQEIPPRTGCVKLLIEHFGRPQRNTYTYR